MEINIKKRHFVILVAGIFALFLIIPNYRIVQKILNAKEISELNGIYHSGDYVKLSFDKVLYIEYEGLFGGIYKRYAICSTLEGDVFYVNAMPDQYILVEITNPKEIEEIGLSLNKQYQIIGIIEQNTHDVKEFLEKGNADVKQENSIVIKEIEYRDVYVTKILQGCFILFFCMILFYYWGGVHSVIKRKREQYDID